VSTYNLRTDYIQITYKLHRIHTDYIKYTYEIHTNYI
jgi:hypothetical protein